MDQSCAGTVDHVPFFGRPGVVVDVADTCVMGGNPVRSGERDVEDVVEVAVDGYVCVEEADSFGSFFEV